MLEYRLYYDNNGKPITYATEALEGNYIVITKEQYAMADQHIIVKNGVIIKNRELKKVTKWEKSLEGVKTSKYDISILVNDTETEYNTWGLVTYE